jgi:hypothetical protein
VEQVHGSALHDGQCAACCEAHTNFADESACPTADNVRNEVVTIHGSQKVLKMLSPLNVDIFSQLIVSLRTQAQRSYLNVQHIRHQLSLDGCSNCVAV